MKKENKLSYAELDEYASMIEEKLHNALTIVEQYRKCECYTTVVAKTFNEAYEYPIEDVEGNLCHLCHIYPRKVRKGLTWIHEHRYIDVPNVCDTKRITEDNFKNYTIIIKKRVDY